MLFVHKLEKITDPQIRDMTQTEFKSLCCSLFVFLETKYMKDVQKLLTNHLTDKNYLHKT